MSKFVKLSEEAYKFEGKLSLSSAIPLGLQHVFGYVCLANLTARFLQFMGVGPWLLVVGGRF